MIDALPGLYGPTKFREALEHAEKFFQETVDTPIDETVALLGTYHAERLAALEQDLVCISVETYFYSLDYAP